MNSKNLLVGFSLAAFTAGTASAQATGPDFTGSTGVDSRGTNNNPTAASSGNGNASFIFIRGDNNTATVSQNGNLNSSTIRQGEEGAPRNGNIAVHTQESDGNRAVTDQNANNGTSTITQGQAGQRGVAGVGQNFAFVTQNADDVSSTVEQFGLTNSATVTQGGARALSEVRQGRTFDFTDANGVAQAGPVSEANRNVASINQSGADAFSLVLQSAFPGASIQASDNSATIIQQGISNLSLLAQGSRGNSALVAQRGGTAAGPNTSVISQADENSSGADTGANNPMSLNRAISSMSGVGNLSFIQQNGRRNRAENTLSGGGERNQSNTNLLPGSQASFDTVTNENAQANATQRTTLDANGNPTAVEANRSLIDQRGDDLGTFVVASIERDQNTRGRGNQSFVQQGNSAAGVGAAQGRANNHLASVFQRGVVESSNITQRNGTSTMQYAADRNGSRARNAPTFGGGNESDFSRDLSSAGRDAFLRQARAFAAVSTNGDASTVIIDQTGDNQAAVTIGGGANVAARDFDSFNTAAIRQVDAGDFSSGGGGGGNQLDPADPNNPFDNQNNQQPLNPVVVTRAFNTAQVVMQGDRHFARVDQNARNAQATVFQQNLNGVQSLRNATRIDQGQGNAGSGTTNTFGGGQDDQAVGGPRFTAAQAVGAAVNVTANVTQSASRNDAVIFQDGTNLSATVTQRGTGGGAGTANGDTAFGAGSPTTSLRNLVVVSQTGTNNTATATQNAGVGPSSAGAPQSGNTAAQNQANGEPATDDEFFFAGGARSAEIRILQTNDGNTAEVTQNGLGQRARVEQSGARNTAGITQGSLAINATAVIRQFGNDNSFFITQNLGANQFNQAQFAVVTQTGNNNTGNTTIDAAGQPSGLSLTRPQQ